MVLGDLWVKEMRASSYLWEVGERHIPELPRKCLKIKGYPLLYLGGAGAMPSMNIFKV